MRHELPTKAGAHPPILTRRRFQIVAAILVAALLPFALRVAIKPEALTDPPAVNALFANAAAVIMPRSSG